jgi:hypothetical protein
MGPKEKRSVGRAHFAEYLGTLRYIHQYTTLKINPNNAKVCELTLIVKRRHQGAFY